ncbi:MAG: type II toxin-antitoxin system mRNA interferase toxin, RelE/StbE family [Patescibacteria group bacterium]
MIVQYQDTFKKQYQRLPQKMQSQFNVRLRLFMMDPIHPRLRNHPLKGRYFGYWSINISGDVRALYFKEKEQHIIFALIGTHSQLYG